MPIQDGKYVAPIWSNNAPPAIDADELNAMSQSIVNNQQAIIDSDYQVGDIITTTRTDLGDSWILCNGDIFNVQEYPELGTLFPFKPESFSSKILISCSDTVFGQVSASQNFIYDGEKIFTIIQKKDSGDENLISYFAVSEDNNISTWMKYSFYDDGAIPYQGSAYVEKFNDYYVCVWKTESTSTTYYYSYTTDYTGSWTQKSVTLQDGYNIHGVSVANGYLCITANNGGNWYVFYTNNLEGGNFTRTSLVGISSIGAVSYINGEYMVPVETDYNYVGIYKSSSLSSGWSIDSSSYNSTINTGFKIYESENYLIIQGTQYYKDTSDSSWKNSGNPFSYVQYFEPYYFTYNTSTSSQYNCYYRSSINGSLTTLRITNYSGVSFVTQGSCQSDRYIMTTTTETSPSSPSVRRVSLNYLDKYARTLPTITAEGAYVYIKAK